jgi:hypothetical protein
MSALVIPNRPFASDLLTGLMLPDGIFVSAFGTQLLNAQVQNAGGSAEGTTKVYLESVSNPAIVVTPRTHTVWSLAAGATATVEWEADFSSCPEGSHYVSIIAETAAGKTRMIKKILVLRVDFDPATATFTAYTPQGTMAARFHRLVGPKQGTCRPPCRPSHCCCGGDERRRAEPRRPEKGRQVSLGKQHSVLDFAKYFRDHGVSFRFCPPGYLPKDVAFTWTPNPAYAGQYGDLPFDDPWWKVVLCILALLLLIASSIAEAVDGSGEVVVTGDPDPNDEDCCDLEASGGGTSYIAAGLLAAAAAAATIAGLTDDRDAFRRGQDATPPDTTSEKTTGETFAVQFSYPEPLTLGKPFTVGTRWRYTRTTTAKSYSAASSDTSQNAHVIRKYEIVAPDVTKGYDPDEHWIVKAKFYDTAGALIEAARLHVQCFLVSPSGGWYSFLLQDDGNWPDAAAADHELTGYFPFDRRHEKGLWEYYVIAQDVNTASTDLTPEEAAQIIGGMVLTSQLTLSFDGGTCRFVPDGHVNVL